MKKPTQSDHLPLSIVARRLFRSYNSTLRLVMTGRLDGDKVNGHWIVTRESVERAAQRAFGRDRNGEHDDGAR